MSNAWDIIICPICHKEIHRHFAAPIRSAGRASSRDAAAWGLLNAMVLEADRMHRETVRMAEEACRHHFANEHPRRLRLWHRTRWGWLMTRRFPWSRPLKGSEFKVAT